MGKSKVAARYVLPFQSPCKDCEARAVGCHGTCERYAEYRERVAVLAEEKRKKHDVEEYIEKAMKHFPRGRNI